MIVSHRHRFIFLKTRKTAGSSIEAALFPFLGPEDLCTGSERDGTPRLNCPEGLRGHIGWQTIGRLDDRAGAYYWFAFERNPWDKTVSDWLFKRDLAGTFQGGLREYVAAHAPVDWPRYSDGDRPVVELFRYEELQTAFASVDARLGLPLTGLEPHLKRHPDRRPYREYFDDATKASVAKQFAREIAYFGHTF